MRALAWFAFPVAAAAAMAAPLHAQAPDDALRVYAVNIVKTPPFVTRFTGYGIYLGRGIVITAAHVVGRWPFLTRPRVRIAGEDLPAEVLKEGSFARVDLALLAVDDARLPVSLRLRRNPLCKNVPPAGAQVIDVVPQQTSRARIISPLLIAPALRRRFDTLIDTPMSSGSGLFDAERKCLIGIVSAKVRKFSYQAIDGRLVLRANGFAGYFVPAAEIAGFLPADVHF